MPRARNSGVKIILAKRTKLPGWVAHHFINYALYPDELNGKRVRVLVLPGAGASFGNGGDVSLEVKTPNFAFCRPAFRGKSVFEIRDLQNMLLERNKFFCERCVQNSGKGISFEAGTIAGRENVSFECEVCQHKWEVANA